ncbi:MAG: CBS domain-containing protein [Nitrospirae bacterium]|nr:CBS domain-containing protein [Nitrospirota bacterium]
MVKVKEMMTKNLVIVDADTVVREAIRTMTEKKLGSVLVRKGKEIVGILEESDIIKNVLARDINPYVIKVETVMSIPFVIGEENTDNEASDTMVQQKVRRLVVSDGEKIVGILSMQDLLRPVYAGKSFWT